MLGSMGNMFKSPQTLLGLGTLGAGLIGSAAQPDMQMPTAVGDMYGLANQIKAGGTTPAGQVAQGQLVQNIQNGPQGMVPQLSQGYMDAYMNALKMPQEQARQNYATQLNATGGGPFSSSANQLMGQFGQQQSADMTKYLADVNLQQQKAKSD